MIYKNIFITGKPGSGKTTLIRESTLSCLRDVGGFYTQELKKEKKRNGFVLKTFDGKSGILAKKGLASSYKLNKYGIDISVIEGIGIGSIREAMEKKSIVVIDEIGSMETVSEHFRKIVFECLLNPSLRVLGTIRYGSQPFTDELNKMSNTKLVFLSKSEFLNVKKEIKAWIESAISEKHSRLGG